MIKSHNAHPGKRPRTFSPVFFLYQTNKRVHFASSVSENKGWLHSPNNNCVPHILLNFMFSCNVTYSLFSNPTRRGMPVDQLWVYLSDEQNGAKRAWPQQSFYYEEWLLWSRVHKYCIDKIPNQSQISTWVSSRGAEQCCIAQCSTVHWCSLMHSDALCCTSVIQCS